MNIEKLDAAIKAVCPIMGISIGMSTDKATWRIDFEDGATAEQRAAAQAVVDNLDLAAEEVADMKEGILAQVRVLRENVLNRLTGIATRALIAGDSTTATACATAQQGLLDMTTATGVAQANSEAQLKVALVTAYALIVAATPVDVRGAFKDFDL